MAVIICRNTTVNIDAAAANFSCAPEPASESANIAISPDRYIHEPDIRQRTAGIAKQDNIGQCFDQY